MKKMKVNFHICEACNYRCKHCFAKFDCRKTLSAEEWIRIADNVIDSGLVYEINIAGGEPMLHKGLMEIARHIRKRGVDVSLITNGHFMTPEWIRENAGVFKTIGLSIDTLDPERQKHLGRCDSKGGHLTPEEVGERIRLLRETNPKIRIKLNTVVSAVNRDDNLAEKVKGWKIDRWKIMKMQLFENAQFSNRCIEINETGYIKYVERALKEFGHSYREADSMVYVSAGTEIVAEKVLRASYIMIDANGWLVDDSQNDNYTMIADCLRESFTEGYERLPFNRDNYMKRYEEKSERTQPMAG